MMYTSISNWAYQVIWESWNNEDVLILEVHDYRDEDIEQPRGDEKPPQKRHYVVAQA